MVRLSMGICYMVCGKYESPDDNYIMSHDDTILSFYLINWCPKAFQTYETPLDQIYIDNLDHSHIWNNCSHDAMK